MSESIEHLNDQQVEEWRPIAGFPDYQVSNLGRVVSTRRGKPREIRGGWATHRKVFLVGPEGKVGRKVHHLVAEAFHGPRPAGMVVRHLDDVRSNNAASNLAYGTPSQNIQDAVRNGVHGQAKKTHCRQGHPYDEANTYVARCGKRMCRACDRDRGRRRSRTGQTGRREGPLGASKTACVNGHPYDEANTYIRPTGHRDCRACIRDRVNRYQARRAAA